jgi:hypothetical protein
MHIVGEPGIALVDLRTPVAPLGVLSGDEDELALLERV